MSFLRLQLKGTLYVDSSTISIVGTESQMIAILQLFLCSLSSVSLTLTREQSVAENLSEQVILFLTEYSSSSLLQTVLINACGSLGRCSYIFDPISYCQVVTKKFSCSV